MSIGLFERSIAIDACLCSIQRGSNYRRVLSVTYYRMRAIYASYLCGVMRTGAAGGAGCEVDGLFGLKKFIT